MVVRPGRVRHLYLSMSGSACTSVTRYCWKRHDIRVCNREEKIVVPAGRVEDMALDGDRRQHRAHDCPSFREDQLRAADGADRRELFGERPRNEVDAGGGRDTEGA